MLLAPPALAQAYQCSLPRQIDPIRPARPDGPVRKKPVARYLLAASWSPEFCRSGRKPKSMQCSGRHGRFGFVLHGLWPEARQGPAPQWCSTTPRPSPQLIRKHLCMTPVPWLLEHEWAKHGSCMTKRPETYFKVSTILWRSLVWPDADRLSRKKNLTAGDLRDAFLAENPDWRREQIGIETSRNGWLRGVRLCYGRDFMPIRCPTRNFGARDKAALKIWRGL
ncbi:MAG: ribonuclease T [Sphingomonadaceae bacterium]|nr:ribonuclease T [Sphingomonadaceae bacterium]